MILKIYVALVAQRVDGGVITTGDFLDRLAINGLEASPCSGRGGAAKVLFFQMHFEHSDDVEASNKFEQTLKDELRRVRDWLLGHDVELFQSFVESGLVLDMIVSTWIDQDQVDLEFDPGFLRACGERSVGLTIISND